MRMLKTLFAMTALAGMAVAAGAQEAETSDIISLSRELNKLKYYDYSHLALENQIAKNPSDVDNLKIQKASTYFSENKLNEGDKLLKEIGPSSPFYANSRYALGEAFYKKNQPKEAIAAFEEYFKVFATPENLPRVVKSKDLQDQYVTGCMGYLKNLYTATGDTAGMDRALKYNEQLKRATETGDTSSVDAEQVVIRVQTRLDAAEQMKEERRAGWQPIVEEALKNLDALTWRGMDPIAAQAYVEIARCNVILGKPQEALKVLDTNEELMEPFTELFEKQPAWAPEAFASYWRGRAAFDMGKREKDMKKKEGYYIDSLKSYLKLLKKFTENPNSPKALVYIEECKNALVSECKRNVQLPPLPKIQGGAALVSADEQQGDAFAREKKFASARAAYLKAYPKNRKGSAVLGKVVTCLIQEGKLNQARAIAGYLADTFPEDEGAPTALLQVAGTIWDKAAKLKDPAAKAAMIDEALAIYEDYLFAYPTDQFAGPIAARVANEAFRKAKDIGEKVNVTLEPKEKNKLKEQYRKAFLDAVPLFLRIAENYANVPQYANVAVYQAGWCYSNAEKHDEAAAAFLKYCDIETNPKELGAVADSKLRACQSMYNAANAMKDKNRQLTDKAAAIAEKDPDAANKLKEEAGEARKAAIANYFDAIKNVKELLEAWPTERLAEDKSEKKKTALLNAAALLGWVYDGLAEMAPADKQAKYKNMAIEALMAFVAKYPTAKQVPGCMSRVGSLYADLGEFDKAAKTLDQLAVKFPQSPEGKKALFTLARSVFEIGEYPRANDAVKRMFESDSDLTVRNLRWISSALLRLGDADQQKGLKKKPTEQDIKDGSAYALKAVDRLLSSIDAANRVPADWFSEAELVEMGDNAKAVEKAWKLRKDNLLFLGGQACWQGGNYQGAVKYLTELLRDGKTPYYYKGMFLRGDAYGKMKQIPSAIRDLGEIANATDIISLRYKASVTNGDLYLGEKNYDLARLAFYLVAMTPLETIDIKLKEIDLLSQLLAIDEKIKDETNQTKITLAKDEIKKIEDKFVKNAESELAALIAAAAKKENSLPPQALSRVKGKSKEEKVAALNAIAKAEDDKGSLNGAKSPLSLACRDYLTDLANIDIANEELKDRRGQVEKRQYKPLKVALAGTDFNVKEQLEKDKEELLAQRELIGYAIYRDAYCCSALGETKEKEEMIAKYKKYYPTGKYNADLLRLPAGK